MFLAWDPVTLDQLCQPEAAVVYEIAVGQLTMGAGWRTDTPSPTVVQPPAVVTVQPETSYQTGVDPAVGECLMVEVTAIDAAGNRDDDKICLAAGAAAAGSPFETTTTRTDDRSPPARRPTSDER